MATWGKLAFQDMILNSGCSGYKIRISKIANYVASMPCRDQALLVRVCHSIRLIATSTDASQLQVIQVPVSCVNDGA